MVSTPRSASTFSPESLADLVACEIDYIHHADFYSTESIHAALPRIVDECERASYTLTSDLQSLGTSIGEASESSENAERYVRTARATTDLIRDSIFRGLLSPMDLVRLKADEFWPAGATVGRNERSTMLTGIIRRWVAGGQANPHIDQRYIPLLNGYHLHRRIGVNVYLEVPEDGGELEFWGRFDDEVAYEAAKRTDYGLDRSDLGPPQHVVQPKQGDIVLFDAAQIHGVGPVRRGSRVTAACFLGTRTEDDPLVIFA